MSQKFVSNKDKPVRIFENEFLESLTKVHFSIPLIIYIPIILYFIYKSIFDFELSSIIIISLYFGGLIFWTLFEYLMHRFVFHFEPKSKFGKRAHFIFHGVHHDYPKDSMRLVMPPIASLTFSAIIFSIFWMFMPEKFIYAFFSGFWTGYLFYDIGHFAMHHFNINNKYWLKIKKNHMLHHYKDEHHGFGVSMPFWDKIFNTGFGKDEK